MTNVNLNCGTIKNCFTVTEATEIFKVFQKLTPNDGDGNNCFGISQTHPAYLWFKKFFFNRITTEFGPDVKLIFGMLLDCTVPFDVHHDLKPLPDPEGKHYMSCLMPYSVNHDPALCNQAATIVFEQELKSLDQMPVIKNNVANIYQSMLSHIDPVYVDRLSIKHTGEWNIGDLIWWDSRLAHVSSNFIAKGFQSKQCIVVHTYVL